MEVISNSAHMGCALPGLFLYSSMWSICSRVLYTSVSEIRRLSVFVSTSLRLTSAKVLPSSNHERKRSARNFVEPFSKTPTSSAGHLGWDIIVSMMQESVNLTGTVGAPVL